MRFVPLAAESLGVRSMCSFVETPDVKILIDPGASLGPRFRLLPHPKEYHMLAETRSRMAVRADQANVITISHYHFDHATPTYTDYLWNLSSVAVAEQLYRDKIVFAKDYRGKVNPSQRRRGWMLDGVIRKSVKSLEPADGRTVEIGDTVLRFSEPVSHGEKRSPLGWVLMLTVENGGERFMHASDVQGPTVTETAERIISEKPNLLYLGGPPTYLAEFQGLAAQMERAWDNLERIVLEVPEVVIDHHLMRAGEWPQSFQRVIAACERAGNRIRTAAQFLGLGDELLESQRKRLYEKEPPSKEFAAWSKLPEEKRRLTPAPV